jgi:hypothetical protein
MEKDFPYLRADVNAFGHGFIELGRIAPETAQRLAHLLGLAVAAGPDSRLGDVPPTD